MDMTEKPGETIRQWYERTTGRVRSRIVRASGFAAVVTLSAFFAVPNWVILKLQIFNGALSLPVGMVIWIAAFILLFLIPSREAGFRTEESMRRTEKRVEDFIADATERLDRNEKRVDDFIEKEARPALDVWRRTGERIEKEIDAGFFGEARDAFAAVRAMSGPPGTPPDPGRVRISRGAPPVAASAAGNHKSQGA